MTAIGIQSSIWSNRLKTIMLLILFPVLVFGVVFLIMFFVLYSTPGEIIHSTDFYLNQSLIQSIQVFTYLLPIILIWALISFAFYRQIIFAFTDAEPITRIENPEIYNIVENLCISRGIPTPNIGILEDDSLNAFAVGWNPKKSWIVFSRGILNKLNKQEIEAVAAHELTHIMNKDGLLLVTVIVFIGAIAAIGEIMFRSARVMGGSKDSNGKGNQLQLILILVGLALLILGYLVLPLVQLAVSRKREYLADAGSVELTKDKYAMITALQNISYDSTIESIKKDSISALCIENPFPRTAGLSNRFHEFFSTHPTIENRIKMLERY
ncbi:MAG: M48 family metallopeptidase [Candidatus Gracilibacteria bacterium]|nr:M48 family metallopeptidase [Candidatus Gracilibacteria bacterium]MDD2909020.1 M48 family metallopeptidase [Candidatus Gracilibacteria bacterium]